jgi:CheY-like chemotaxis protein
VQLVLRQRVSNDSLLISTFSACTHIRPFLQGGAIVLWSNSGRSLRGAESNGINGASDLRTFSRRAGMADYRKTRGATVIVVDSTILVFQSAQELLASEFPAINACLQLDVWMPGMSGIELCRSIAASGRHLPTILMSGFDDEHTRQIMREVEPPACSSNSLKNNWCV